jgi:hypothetical protein
MPPGLPRALTRPLLIGGSSSTGKTTAALAVSQLLGSPCVHLDAYLETVQDARSNFSFGEADLLSHYSAALCERLVQLGEQASPHIAAMIPPDQRYAMAQVIEGERILPALLDELRQSRRALGVFIIEDDPNVLYATLAQRSSRFAALPEAARRKVAEMDVLYGGWLRQEAERRALPWEPSRPWVSLVERLVAHVIPQR